MMLTRNAASRRHSREPQLRRSAKAIALLIMLAVTALSGCATTRNDDESDLPWNARQPWEGAPTLPGMQY